MDKIDNLTEYFSKFPGIGTRQAKRFVYFLLTRNNGYLNELSDLIQELKKDIKVCESCCRFYTPNNSSNNPNLCNICINKNRDRNILMVVAKDTDLTNIERVGNYNGMYFVLGGFVSVLEKYPKQKIKIEKLLNIIQKRMENKELKEIILALSLNPDGENTMEYVSDILKPLVEKHKLKISTLGRGLSTGTELEYLDNNTFENAFKNRV
ncbi:MAG: recombination protein RecR [Candidatus Pacebacteria bacterium]|nr:recombination protein RecR [Candidatus Paceibacterota bacterium]